MPLCSRCTGLYTGFIVSFAILVLVERKSRRGLPQKKITISLIVFTALMAGESTLSFLHFIPTLKIFRFLTGYLAGWLAAPMIAGLMNNVAVDIKQSVNGGYVSNNKTIVKWLSPAPFFAVLFYFTYKKALIFWSIFSLAGMAFFIASMIFILIFSTGGRLSNSVSRPGRYILFFFLSLIISVILIMASSWLKILIRQYLQF